MVAKHPNSRLLVSGGSSGVCTRRKVLDFMNQTWPFFHFMWTKIDVLLSPSLGHLASGATPNSRGKHVEVGNYALLPIIQFPTGSYWVTLMPVWSKTTN